MMKAGELLLHAVGTACIADTGYDADWFRDLLKFLGLKAVIAFDFHPFRDQPPFHLFVYFPGRSTTGANPMWRTPRVRSFSTFAALCPALS